MELRIQRATHSPFKTSSDKGDASASITVVCIFDTHNAQPADVPDGDLLLHAGDLTRSGSFAELQAQLDWLNSLPHRHKVVVAGNHDVLLNTDFAKRHPERIRGAEDGKTRADLDWGDLVYLENSVVRLVFPGLPRPRSLVIYGSPRTPDYGTWAFQYARVRPGVWANTVPDDTDILLVHGPPKGHLDAGGKGCPQLLRELRRVRPKLAVFGHIHDGLGHEVLVHDDTADAAYDGAMLGERGLPAVAQMAWCLLWSYVWGILPIPRWLQRLSRTRECTHLVNAAVMAPRLAWEPPKLQPAIVVEL